MAHETIHNNFYQISMNCHPGTATTGFTANLSRFGTNSPKCLCIKHLHTKSGFSNRAQSCLIVANRVIFVNNLSCQSLVRQPVRHSDNDGGSSAKRSDGGIAPNFYQFSMNSTFRGPIPPRFSPRQRRVQDTKAGRDRGGIGAPSCTRLCPKNPAESRLQASAPTILSCTHQRRIPQVLLHSGGGGW